MTWLESMAGSAGTTAAGAVAIAMAMVTHVCLGGPESAAADDWWGVVVAGSCGAMVAWAIGWAYESGVHDWDSRDFRTSTGAGGLAAVAAYTGMSLTAIGSEWVAVPWVVGGAIGVAAAWLMDA